MFYRSKLNSRIRYCGFNVLGNVSVHIKVGIKIIDWVIAKRCFVTLVAVSLQTESPFIAVSIYKRTILIGCRVPFWGTERCTKISQSSEKYSTVNKIELIFHANSFKSFYLNTLIRNLSIARQSQ